jgi:NADH dehydrogenase
VRYANFDGEQSLATRTVIWSAGVAASPLGKQLGVEVDRAGRVPVSPELNIAGHEDVYVIGDLAAAQSDGKPVPGVSPAAKQMGRVAARNIRHRIAGQKPETFVYQDYGSLATIGRKAAIAMVGKLKFSGYPAWLFWLFVHVYFLIGFRNRIMVMADWAWAYFTFKRSARVISATMPTQAEAPTLRKEVAE